MKLIIDIDEEDFKIMKHNITVDNPLCPISQKEMVAKIANGVPLDKIKAEILLRDKNVKNVRTDGHCFFTAEEIVGIIDKYKVKKSEEI